MSKAPPKNFIRSKRHGCFVVRNSPAWGMFLQPVDDPQGKRLTNFERESLQLIKDFPKVPPELWSRIIGLYFYMCPPAEKLSANYHDNQLEVQVCFLRDAETKNEWKVVVPKQIVSGISVKSELNQCIDIATGEKYDQFPPQGWLHAGSSHSHNTMDAFFSSIDDKSELTVPGMHIVIGNIDQTKMEYSYQASIVLRKLRKDIDLDKVVAVNHELELEFHEDVLEYIDTVMTANTKLYAELGKLSEDKSETGETVELSLFDKDGKPDGFFLSLDKNNSDLFDDDEFSEDSELMSMVGDKLKQGMSVADVIKNIEAAHKVTKPKQKYNEYCGECGRQVETDWEACPNCEAVFVDEEDK